MNSESYVSIVADYRQSTIVIGCVVFAICFVAALIVEFYVRYELDLKFLHIGRFKISPTWFVAIIMLISIIYTTIVVRNCDRDIQTCSYETYEGDISYQSRTITLCAINVKVRVSSGYDIVPYGDSYGKCVFASNSKIIVDYAQVERP